MNPTSARTLRAALAAGASLAAFGAPAAAQAAPTIISTAQHPSVVAAHGDTIVWSEINPATGSYRLVKSESGGPKEVMTGVAEGTGEGDDGNAPFDVDLGTNATGRLYAVYTRQGIIYRAPVAGGAEQRLNFISLGGTNHSPTISRGRIAFVHGQQGKDSLRYTTSTARKPSQLRKGVFDSVELGEKHLAYVEQVKGIGFGGNDVHVRNTSTGRDAVVYRARSGGASAAGVTRPTADAAGDAFSWARTNNGSGTGNRIIRYRLAGSKLTYAKGSSRYASVGYAGGDIGAIVSTALDPRSNQGCGDAGVNYCRVFTTGQLTFTDRP